MKKLFLSILSLALIMITTVVFAATTNPSPASPGYTPMVIPIMGDYTTSKTGIIKFTAPYRFRVVNATVNARASSGTNPTLKVRALSGVLGLYSTSGAITAGTVKQATLAASPIIVDESAVTMDLVIGGTDTPTWSDITLMLLLKRL
jgi:hypothetical protein